MSMCSVAIFDQLLQIFLQYRCFASILLMVSITCTGIIIVRALDRQSRGNRLTNPPRCIGREFKALIGTGICQSF